MNNDNQHACPPPKDDWSISATLLNVLWGELFPRAAALVWKGGWAWPVASSDARLWLADVILEFLNGAHGNKCFLERIQKVRQYLLGPDPTIPITYRGEGAYDFILSDEGIDLFAPPRPPDTDPDFSTAVYQLYTFRRTGRQPVGLPASLPAQHRPVPIAEPTGPSQIHVPLSAIAAGTLEPGKCVQDVVVENIRFMVRRGGGRAQGREITVADDDPRGRWTIEEREEEVALLPDLECYKCVATGRRCWQIDGSVYRGILAELPRVVATIWWEQSAGLSGPSGYQARYGGNNDDEHRSIFQERSETSLPLQAKMVFADQATPRVGAPPQFFWDANEVMITNRGFYFPELPANAPNRAQVLEAIIDGRAGNVVFTDSARSMD